MALFRQTDNAVYSSSNYIKEDSFVSQQTGEKHAWLTGWVKTGHGIVAVIHSEPPRFKDHYGTCLEFVYDGRCYTRFYQKQYSARYLVTLCKEFAADVVEGDSLRDC